MTGSQTTIGSSANTPSNAVVKNGTTNVTENYNITYVPGTLQVTSNANAIVINSESKSWTYNGQNHKHEVYTVTYNGVSVSADSTGKVFTLSTGDTITITATATGVKYVSDNASNNNTYTYVLTNANQYGSVSASYGTLSITKASLTITADSASRAYNGSALTDSGWMDTPPVGLQGTDAVESVTVTGSQTTIGSSANTPSNAVVKNGTTNVTENYNITYVPGTLTITKASLTITADSASRAYNGSALTDSGWMDTPPVGLQGTDAVESVTVTGSQTTVGSSSNVSSNAVVKNGTNDVTANYEITYVPGTLQVTSNANAIVINSESNSWTYDGQNHKHEVYSVNYQGNALTADSTGKVFTLPTGDTITITATATGVKKVADTAANNNTFTYVITNADQYGSVSPTFGTLTVTPESVTVSTGTASRAYNGTALTESTAAISGLVTGESVTLTATGSQTEVGSSSNSYSIIWSGADAGNYTVTENLGTLTVTGNDTVITFTGSSASKVYDGTALTSADVTVTGLPDGFTYEAAASGSQTDAGSSANKVSAGFVIKNAAGEDRTSSFTNVSLVDGTLTVEPAVLTVRTESATANYSGQPLTADGELLGLVEGETVTFTVTGSLVDPGTAVNTYSLVWNGTAKKVNYVLYEVLGQLKVIDNSIAPQTGDNGRIRLRIALCAVSGICMLTSFGFLKRRKKER